MVEGELTQGIATAIQALRQERGWSQRELGRQAELSPAYLSELEAGRKDPSADVMNRLASAFNVGIDHFLWIVLVALLTGEVPGIQRREAALKVARAMLETDPAKRHEIEEFIQFQRWRSGQRSDTRSRSTIVDETETEDTDLTEER